MDFKQFTDHKWDNSTLILKIQLDLGQYFEAPFTLIKKDRPLELASKKGCEDTGVPEELPKTRVHGRPEGITF